MHSFTLCNSQLTSNCISVFVSLIQSISSCTKDSYWLPEKLRGFDYVSFNTKRNFRYAPAFGAQRLLNHEGSITERGERIPGFNGGVTERNRTH